VAAAAFFTATSVATKSGVVTALAVPHASNSPPHNKISQWIFIGVLLLIRQ
jgi:hypothetical protein